MLSRDIKLDIADCKEIFSNRGEVGGVIGECRIDEITNIFNDTLKNSLGCAKAVLINIKLHKERSLMSIVSFLETIQDFTKNEPDIIFSTQDVDDIDFDVIGYGIIITGKTKDGCNER